MPSGFKIYWMNRLSIKLIRRYQYYSRNSEHKCLHYPTCSNYAILALEKYPFLTAVKKTVTRLRDCNPFSDRDYFDYP